PGIEVAVELVRAERVVHVAQGDVTRPEAGRKVRGGGQLQIAVVAIRHESGGEVARGHELFGYSSGRAGERDALLVGAEIPKGCAEPDLGSLGRRGDDVDGPRDGVRTVHGGTRAAQHFNARDRFQRHADIHVVVSRLRVV